MSPLRVFLCCAHEDIDRAHALAQPLFSAGADIWVADLESAPPETVQRECSIRPVCIVILSKAALASAEVGQIAKTASDLYQRDPTRLILPVLVETLDVVLIDQWPFLSAVRRIESAPGEALPSEKLIHQTLEMLALAPASASGAESPSIYPVEQGQALLAQRRYAEAQNVFENETQRLPDSFDAWFCLSSALNGRSRFPEALNICDRLLTLRPTDPLAWSQKAETLNNLRLFRDALVTAEQALRFDAALPKALVNKGQALSGLHRYHEGLMTCDEALRLAPYDVRAWHSKGFILRRYNLRPQALAAIDQALALDPFYASSLVSRAIASTPDASFGGGGHVTYVLGMLDHALQIEPENLSSLMAKALFLLGAARQERAALETINYALHLAPQNAHVWSVKAVILNEAGLFRDALAAAEQALALNRNETQAWFAKGEVYFRLSRFHEAVAAFDAGLQADPDDEELLNDKGAALQGLGRRADAIAAYDHVLRINPNHELARRNRASA